MQSPRQANAQFLVPTLKWSQSQKLCFVKVIKTKSHFIMFMSLSVMERPECACGEDWIDGGESGDGPLQRWSLPVTNNANTTCRLELIKGNKRSLTITWKKVTKVRVMIKRQKWYTFRRGCRLSELPSIHPHSERGRGEWSFYSLREAILSTSFYYTFMRLSHAKFPFFGIKFRTTPTQKHLNLHDSVQARGLKGIMKEHWLVNDSKVYASFFRHPHFL